MDEEHQVLMNLYRNGDLEDDIDAVFALMGYIAAFLMDDLEGQEGALMLYWTART